MASQAWRMHFVLRQDGPGRALCARCGLPSASSVAKERRPCGPGRLSRCVLPCGLVRKRPLLRQHSGSASPSLRPTSRPTNAARSVVLTPLGVRKGKKALDPTRKLVRPLLPRRAPGGATTDSRVRGVLPRSLPTGAPHVRRRRNEQSRRGHVLLETAWQVPLGFVCGASSGEILQRVGRWGWRGPRAWRSRVWPSSAMQSSGLDEQCCHRRNVSRRCRGLLRSGDGCADPPGSRVQLSTAEDAGGARRFVQSRVLCAERGHDFGPPRPLRTSCPMYRAFLEGPRRSPPHRGTCGSGDHGSLGESSTSCPNGYR